jgi:Mg2+-importing ATPase
LTTIILPFSPLAKIFGFAPLPPEFLLYIFFIILGYVLSAEIAKKIFYKKVKF